jgi:uncharacterized protein (TIGR03435 family)
MPTKLRLLVLPGLLLAASVETPAQQTPAAPVFEVAAINPSPPLDVARIVSSGGNLSNLRIGVNMTDTRVDIAYMSLSNLMPVAFKVQPYQVSGPSWLNDSRFDIQATIPAGATREQVPEMLQALLAERFGMVAHRESREMAIYSLIVGKEGSKLTAAALEPDAPTEPAPGDVVVGAGGNQVRLSTGTTNGTQSMTVRTGRASMNMSMSDNGMMQLDVSRMTIAELVQLLTQLSGRPVVDDTGLAGEYQMKLQLSMADLLNVARASGIIPGLGATGGAPGAALPAAGASDPSGSSVFEAVQKLGLKLEPKRAPIEVVVIDKIERNPTPN